MAFPGSRVRQKKICILASAVAGAISHDMWVPLYTARFDNADLTLGGEFALQESSLAASLDASGLYQIPIAVKHFELSATPANSRVVLWVRIPQDYINTIDDCEIWLWWLSDDDARPADDEDFGAYDVFGAITDSTETSVPLLAGAVFLYGEDATGAAPQFSDHTGNGRDCTIASGTTFVNVDAGPDVGVAKTSGYAGAGTAYADMPGTGEWSVMVITTMETGENTNFTHGSGSTQRYMAGTVSGEYFNCSGAAVYISSSDVGISYIAMCRSGATVACYRNSLSTTFTIGSNVDFNASNSLEPVAAGGTHNGECFWAVIKSAPNAAWHNLMGRFVRETVGTFESFESNEVGVTGVWTTIAFDGLRSGSEVRVYESPHAAKWTLDLSGATSADIGADYVDFDIVTSTATDRHYIWWTTDPALAGATGHQVTRSGGETDEQLAAIACAVIDGLSDISAAVDGAVITAENARIGFTAKPLYHGLEGAVAVTQIGGTAETEIGGIETSTGTSFAIPVLVDSPRRISVAMMSDDTEIMQFLATLTRGVLIVNARPLQRKDYAND